MHSFQQLKRKIFPKRDRGFKGDYRGDNFSTRRKNLGFMSEARFSEAYDWSAHTSYNGKAPPWAAADLRWRAHICLWAATQAMKIEGDFMECGVDTAITSGTIIKAMNFANVPRKFFLFDTFSGIPDLPTLNATEKTMREQLNSQYYFDSYDFVRAKMANYPNVEIVRGILPETLGAIEGRKIAYLSIDLNNAASERAVMDRVWHQLSPGAIVVIDDYAFADHDAQYAMWNAFAAEAGLMVATLPTGQGLLIKG